MAEPTFQLDNDGRHVWWTHECQPWAFDVGQDGKVTEGIATSKLPAAGGNGWTIANVEPLTVTPSILCRNCGTHGFITDGKWVDA